MGGDKDDGLGLSLSLGCSENNLAHHHPPSLPPSFFPLNLMHSSSSSLPRKSTIFDAFQSSSDRDGDDTRSFVRGIDVNRAADCEYEDAGVSSPNSTVSSVMSGKRCERELENEAERPSSSMEEDDDGGGDAAARKKLRLSKEQSALLEETFKQHSTLNPKQKLALANQLNLRPRQVEVWFQNRRARTKLKQTEVDCEYLRRCCENLTEENRRLRKEVNELRALKLSPQFYMNTSPPTTLTMCPSCERVAVSSAATTTSSSLPATGNGGATASHHPNATVLHSHRPTVSANSWAAILPQQPQSAHRPQS